MMSIRISFACFLALMLSIPSLAQTRHFENYSVQNLDRINSTVNDFGACISVDDQTMLFVSERTGGVGLEDFWMSNRTGPSDGDWSEPINLTSMNSTVADGAISMTADGQRFYFATNRQTSVGNDVNIWTGWFGADNHLKLAPLSVNTTSWESQPAISADGKTLFFASNRGNKSVVGIYTSHLQADSSWSDPVGLGSKINVGGYDASPFLSPDGKTLYFASTRPGGKGGLDLYQSTWFGPNDTDWSDPVDLPEPINSASNEFFLSIPAYSNTIYFTSDRPGGRGKFDLYAASPSAAATAASQRRLSGVQVSISPNPARGRAIVTFSMPQPQGYTFSIEDLKGTKVLDFGAAGNSRGTLDIDLTDLASGAYLFVTTSASGERDAQRLAVIK